MMPKADPKDKPTRREENLVQKPGAKHCLLGTLCGPEQI
jgi:hypothetical protein